VNRRLTLSLIASLVALAVAVAGCGGAGQTPSPTPNPNGGGLDLGSFDLGSFALPSFTTDAALEAMIPDQLGGQALDKLSFTGDAFMGSGQEGSAQVQALLGSMGKTPGDLSVAFGGNSLVTVIAYQIKGVPASSFMSTFTGLMSQQQQVTASQTSYAGKSVTKLTAETGDVSYVYGSGDVLFFVAGGTQDLTDAILTETFQKLP
jgi:hypothetical protein